MTYSLIIPIYNEYRTLPVLLEKLYKLDKKIEIIIVDDGSNDETKNLLINNDDFKIISNKINKGKGKAIKDGVALAKNQNIIIMDGDLEVDIEQIPFLIKKYEKNNADSLVGIRWEKYNKNIKNDLNKFGNYMINKFFNELFKTNFNDVLCCVKIIDTNKFKSLKIKSNGFSVEAEIMAKLVLGGFKIKEVNIDYNRRTSRQGKKLKISDSWAIIWKIINIRFLYKN
tara:strand:+ start:2117 stop:2797 length:681 start_codon:yes stop_codon:yes gene_type:complete